MASEHTSKAQEHEAQPDVTSSPTSLAETRGGAAPSAPARSSLPVHLPVGAVAIGRRLRPLKEAGVANLMVSIGENGFTGSILVRPIAGEEGDQRYELVWGHHRLVALRRLGVEAVPAVVRILSDDEAWQLQIDENLIRSDLSPLERGEHLLERFSVWARRFPDRIGSGAALAPKRGRPGKSDILSQFSDAPSMGFAQDTAEGVGLSRRSVERAWAMVNGIPADQRSRLHNTWVSKNDGVLRQLASIGNAEELTRVIDRLLAGETKNVSDARALAAGNTPSSKAPETPTDETLKAFRAVWGRATPGAREAILADLQGKSLPKGWAVTHG